MNLPAREMRIVEQLLDHGLPQMEIARRTGLSRDTIAERYGDQIANLRAAGLTQYEVVARLEISQGSVWVVERNSRARHAYDSRVGSG